MSNRQQTIGLVLGKFMPLHNGHVHLIEFANSYCDHLTVVVDSQPGQPIDGEIRVGWIQREFSNVNVEHLSKYMPQYPEEHSDFWNIWKTELKKYFPGGLDYVFASESYGQKLAEVLDATFIPVDPHRFNLPISGTQMRATPLKNWEYIPRSVRPYFVKKVCIFGPESTGKSTLALDLAKHFNTTAVPEYARILLESQDGKIDYQDIERIAKGQAASEDSLAYNANKILFCDSDLLLTTIWSDWLFQKVPSWVARQAEQRAYDLYLVADVDVPWIDDKIRYLPNERKSFFDRCTQELQKRNRPYKVISGDWDNRFKTAVDAVGELISDA